MAATKSNIPWGEIRIAVVSRFMTMQEAADKFGVSFGSISSRSSREGWFKSQSQSRVCEVQPEIAESLAESRRVSESIHNSVKDLTLATREELRDRIQKTAGRVVAKGLAHAEKQDGDFVLAKADKIKSLVDAGAKATGFGDEADGGRVVVSLNFLAELPDHDPVPISGRVVESPHAEDEGEEAGPDEGEAGDE